MEPTKLSGAGKQRNPSGQKLTWSFYMKEAVHFIHNDFKFTPRIREQIFFKMFEAQIRSSGFNGPVPHRRLSAQWGERTKSPAHQDWVNICSSVQSYSPEEQARKEDLKVRIEAIARSLGPSRMAAQPTKIQPSQSNITRPSHPQSTRDGDTARSHIPIARAPSCMSNENHVAPNGRRMGQSQTMRNATALSKRPAVAYWDPASSESEIEVSVPVPKRRRVSTDPQVVVPRTPSKDTSARQRASAASKSPSKKRAPPSPKSARSQRTDLLVHRRRDDSTIMLTKVEVDAIQMELEPPSEHAARPPLPSLLFRYWSENPTCDRDSRRGFTARLYHKSNVIPCRPPAAEGVDLVHVFNHMDRKMDKSPFISTSNRLIWIVQLLLKCFESGDYNGRLSVIDTAALDKRTIFWARPYHDEIRKSRAFSNGAHRYRGTYEFLVWHRIPKEAIIHTIAADDLLRLARTDEAMKQILQFEVLQTGGSLSRTKLPALKAKGVPLTEDLTAAIARLCDFFGLNAKMPDKLTHIVSDVIQGWGLRVEKRDEKQWYQLATLFAKEICRRSKRLTFVDQEKVKFAFLTGVGYGRGEVNCRFHQKLLVKQQKAASAVGLASPARIIANQLDAVKMAVLSTEKMEIRSLDAYHQRRVASLEESEDEYELLGNATLRQRLVEDSSEEGEDGSDDEDGIVFGFGDNGLII